MRPTDQNTDNDLRKGATDDNPKDKAMTSLSGQLGHRDQDPLLKSNDSDFPEPGETPEHNGQFKERNQKEQDTRFLGGRDPERRGVGAEKKPGVEGGPDQPSEEPEIKEPDDQQPGDKQKQGQGDRKKDDDLAA
jgi:hypothetical protein